MARGARALVVVPDLGAGGRRSGEARLEEAVGLSAAISLDIVGAEVVRVRSPRPATLFGTGPVEVLAATVAGPEAELVVVDGNVSPIQQLGRASCRERGRKSVWILGVAGAL